MTIQILHESEPIALLSGMFLDADGRAHYDTPRMDAQRKPFFHFQGMWWHIDEFWPLEDHFPEWHKFFREGPGRGWLLRFCDTESGICVVLAECLLQ